MLLNSGHQLDEPTSLLKLIDFGSACFFKKEVSVTQKAGTLHFAAPEVFDGAYTEKCDIWSMGVVVYLACVGYLPFSGSTDRETLGLVKSGESTFEENHWKSLPDTLRGFVSSMLTKDPADRPSAKVLASDNAWLAARGKDCCLLL